LLNKWPEGCQLCSFAAAIASLVQFYTQEQTPSNSLQCNVADVCESNAGPCCYKSCSADSGLGPCLDKAECLMTVAVSSIEVKGSILALRTLTGKNKPATGSVAPFFQCKDKEFPDGRVTAYPDASGATFWYYGPKLTPAQLDKVLALGNPVIILLKYESVKTSFAFTVAAKSASNYKLWSPSTYFNPDQEWKSIDYDGISQMTYTTWGQPEWVYSVWGGGSDAMLC